MADQFTQYVAKANEAVRRKNWDYALEMYKMLFNMASDKVEYRLEARKAARAKLNDVGAMGKMKRMKESASHSTKYKTLMLKKDFMGAVNHCEEFLWLDPNDKTVLLHQAEAALQAGKDEMALHLYLDCERAFPEGDVKLFLALGDLYDRFVKDPNEATKYFRKVADIEPTNREAASRIRSLAAKITMSKGIEDAAMGDEKNAYRGALANADQAAELEDAQRAVRTTSDAERAVNRVKEEIKAQPDNPHAYSKLGDLHVKAKNWDQAKAAYRKSHELDPTNNLLLMKIGDIDLSVLEDKRLITKKAYEANRKDAKLKQAAMEAYKAWLVASIKEYTRRHNQQPLDMSIRHKLAMLLFKAKKYTDALGHFQKTVSEPSTAREARLHMGLCFQQLGQHQQAINTYKKALLEYGDMVNEKVLDLHWYIAQCWEAMEDIDQALKEYLFIYERDISYRSVADKVKELQGSNDQGSNEDIDISIDDI